MSLSNGSWNCCIILKSVHEFLVLGNYFDLVVLGIIVFDHNEIWRFAIFVEALHLVAEIGFDTYRKILLLLHFIQKSTNTCNMTNVYFL